MGPYKKINKITETQSLGRERETTKNNWESKLSQRVITNRRRSLCTCPISHRRMNNLTHTHTKKKHVVAKITRGSGFGNRQKFELSATPSTQKKKKREKEGGNKKKKDTSRCTMTQKNFSRLQESTTNADNSRRWIRYATFSKNKS